MSWSALTLRLAGLLRLPRWPKPERVLAQQLNTRLHKLGVWP